MISVIIPTYKPGDYFKECLYSIINQTLRKDAFEVIIVLNGEKEPYFRQINSTIEHQSNFSLYYIDNKSVSEARNFGMNISTGDYIIFIDDDDIISHNYVEYMNSAPNNTSIIVSNVKTFTESIQEAGDDYLSNCFNRNYGKQTGMFLKRSFLSSACCKLIPKSIIGTRLFNPDFYTGEDSLFMFELSDKINKINLTDPSVIYYRRLREGSVSRSVHNKRTWAYKLKLIRAYTVIYLKKFWRYNLFIYISRIISTLR